MHPGNVVDFVTLGPRLITCVILHHKSRGYASYTDEKRDYERDEAEDRMWICRLFPAYMLISLKASDQGGHYYRKSNRIMQIVHEEPPRTVVPLCCQKSET